MKHELTVAFLWAIATVVTLLTVERDAFTVLGPVFAVCMIGSVVTVRAARSARGRSAT